MARSIHHETVGKRRSLWQRIKELALTDVGVVAQGGIAPGSLQSLEALLLEADFGVSTTTRLVDDVERAARVSEVRSADEFLGALRDGVEAALRAGNSDPSLHLAPVPPTVVLVIGVNGAGKTTVVGKLAERLRRQGKRVLVAAGDTFRAGAVDQLRIWAERSGAKFVGGATGRDPAAVAVDAIEAGVASGADVILIDTAGRLHTSTALMEELMKVARVVGKRSLGGPHETLLVLDATIGQNALAQAKTFAAAVPLTGLVMTKLDGTAKGGVVVAVHEAVNVPVKFIGVGEGIEDLIPFDAASFAGRVLET
jgi:fused signal recognition particle receptor